MVVWAHGLEGSPWGRKAQALRQAGLPLVAPDGRGQPLAQRIVALEQAIHEAAPGALLVGSSYGGLAAAWLATRLPDLLCGLVLLAPALHHQEPPVADPGSLQAPPGLQVRILHGLADTVVPIEGSRRYASRSPEQVKLIEVDDDHRLTDSIQRIVSLVQEMHAR